MPRCKPFGANSRKKLRASRHSLEKARWFRFYDDIPEVRLERYDDASTCEYKYLDISCKQPKQKKCTIVDEEIEKETSEEEDHDDPIHIFVKEETDIEKTPTKVTIPRRPRLRRVVKRRIVKDKTEGHNVLERKIIRRSEYSKKDECDTFGEYISVSLRKHDERTRSMIKQAINNILFEQEMKKYNGGQHYAVVLSEMDDANPLILGEECEK